MLGLLGLVIDKDLRGIRLLPRSELLVSLLYAHKLKTQTLEIM